VRAQTPYSDMDVQLPQPSGASVQYVDGLVRGTAACALTSTHVVCTDTELLGASASLDLPAELVGNAEMARLVDVGGVTAALLRVAESGGIEVWTASSGGAFELECSGPERWRARSGDLSGGPYAVLGAIDGGAGVAVLVADLLLRVGVSNCSAVLVADGLPDTATAASALLLGNASAARCLFAEPVLRHRGGMGSLRLARIIIGVLCFCVGACGLLAAPLCFVTRRKAVMKVAASASPWPQSQTSSALARHLSGPCAQLLCHCCLCCMPCLRSSVLAWQQRNYHTELPSEYLDSGAMSTGVQTWRTEPERKEGGGNGVLHSIELHTL